jgi:hypothetical protein
VSVVTAQTHVSPLSGRGCGLKRGGSPGRPTGALNKATREIREAARAILERPEYRIFLQERLDAGKAPHMETLLHHYASGKPKEQLDIDARLTAMPRLCIVNYLTRRWRSRS